MIETAILLAAGEGSRLRSVAPFKPLCPVAGRTLLAHALLGLSEAGLTRAVVVLGYGATEIESYLTSQAWPIIVETVRVEDYRLPNGTSVLAAEPLVGDAEAVLAMCDHLVDPVIYRRMAQIGASGGTCLAIDRRLDSKWIDLEDVTCALTEGEQIAAIGKGLDIYNAFDAGVFAIGPALFAALRQLEAPSLTEGMRVLAARGAAFATDCSDLDWIDVDDERALDAAIRWCEQRS